MKTRLNSKFLWWGVAILSFFIVGTLAYIFLPGQGNLPDLPAPEHWPTNGWQTAAPETQGFDSAEIAAGLQDLHEKNPTLDSLLIVRNGYLVLNAHFYPYDGSFPHDVASVTKSITTTLVAIAVEQGRLQFDQPVVSFFPERTIANLDARKESMTVLDLVSMRNGMESSCFHGDEPTLDAMRSQPDWVQAALDRPMVARPGTRFCYDSPGMHLLSAILQKVTGLTELEYARQVLFGPLGIQDVLWEADPQGYTHGWGDLHLKPEDAAKLGLLWLQRGAWEGQQIVPAAWTSEAVRAHSRLVGNEFGYGYGWWVSPMDFYALGREGQYLRIIPALNTVIVINGGGYDEDQVFSFLLQVLLGAKQERPANPAGVAGLETTLAALLEGPAPQAPASLPAIAAAISGKNYACETNPASITRLRLDFDSPASASLSMTRYGQDVVWPVGLDGNFLFTPQGQGQRGYWQDAQTFTLELFDAGLLTRQLHFDGSLLEVVIPEAGLTLECQVQTP